MHYNNVNLAAIGYELAPNVVTSGDIEDRLRPLYESLHLTEGQLEALTGISERRFWDEDHTMCEKAAIAGQKALITSGISPQQVGMLIYGGVCRDNLEPATACAVAHNLEIPASAQVYDVSNACLGVMNGMVQVANAIELGQIQAGLVVSCESSRQIINYTIERMLEERDIAKFKSYLATLTGGSGAVGVLLANKSLVEGHRLLGWVNHNSVKHHKLCRWGPDTGMPSTKEHIMETDPVGVLNHGTELAKETFDAFREELAWDSDKPDKIICHQVGAAHQKAIVNNLGIPEKNDFTTFEYLGNMGTVSLLVTAAIASEREFLETGDNVGFLGIGSGLNCMMIGIEW